MNTTVSGARRRAIRCRFAHRGDEGTDSRTAPFIRRPGAAKSSSIPIEVVQDTAESLPASDGALTLLGVGGEWLDELVPESLVVAFSL
jgi:hypothetical protein